MKNSIFKIRHSIITLIMIVISGVEAFASTPWTVNPSDYRYDMTLYLDVSFASINMNYSKYDVAVFSGDECRGIAEVLSLGDGKECLYLRARSNQETGETMTFKYYNKETQEIRQIDGASFTFESNGRLGYPSNPYIVDNTRYFNVNLTSGVGGTINPESGRVPEGTELTITAIPLEGYHFKQWSDGDTANPRTIIVENDITLAAEFEVNTYKLTYVVDGETYKEYTIDYGTAIIPEALPEKEGHTFSGWDGLPETMPAHDVIISGTFSINSYMLTVYLDNVIYIEQLLEFGTPLNIPEPEIPDGRKFNGWNMEIPETMPAFDLEIYGTTSIITGIHAIFLDENVKLTVYDIKGVLILKNSSIQEVEEKLASGLYIINGKKVLIR